MSRISISSASNATAVTFQGAEGRMTPAVFNALRWSKALQTDLTKAERHMLLIALCRDQEEQERHPSRHQDGGGL